MKTHGCKDPLKIALLIGSPWGGLQGPINDVNLIEGTLRSREFEIIRCYGQDATKLGILDAWNSLIGRLQEARQNSSTCEPHVVVVYYSGHGGLVRASSGEDEMPDGITEQNARQYQFLVPSDFRNTDDEFSGILDIQIAHLLTRTTDQTENVTVILDCCHAGRMARDPQHPNAVRKSIPVVTYRGLDTHVERLRGQGQSTGETYMNGNPFAVRVAAAATAETAWEYPDENGQHIGALTKALVTTLEESPVEDVSWRTTLLRVRELVNCEFPQQHPHVEGPDTRLLFSTLTSSARVHALLIQDDLPIIQAGRIAGVKEGNWYTIMPPGFEQPNKTDRLCRAQVRYIDAVRSLAELSDVKRPIPREGAVAILEAEALYRWTASYPEKNAEVKELLQRSKYLRPRSSRDLEQPLVKITQDHDGTLHAYDRAGDVLLASGRDATAASSVVRSAEKFARGHHLLTLAEGSGSEAFRDAFQITVGRVQIGTGTEDLPDDGSAVLEEGQRIYAALRNRWSRTIYISVFNISATGDVVLVSAQGETGIPISAGEIARMGESPFGDRLLGLKILWEDNIPRRGSLSETLIFIVTSAPLDLRHLENSHQHRGRVSQDSELEFLMCHLATGSHRPVQPQRSFAPVQYAVHRFPFSLHHRPQA